MPFGSNEMSILLVKPPRNFKKLCNDINFPSVFTILNIISVERVQVTVKLSVLLTMGLGKTFKENELYAAVIILSFATAAAIELLFEEHMTRTCESISSSVNGDKLSITAS